jgi:hypothetical protein
MRRIVWFSCGVPSAVAAKLAVARWPETIVAYCDLSRDEHEDNARFARDVETWIGKPIVQLSHPKYKTTEECFRHVGYIVGPYGASCTKHMKRKVRETFQQPDDIHIFGYTQEESARFYDFELDNPTLSVNWIL